MRAKEILSRYPSFFSPPLTVVRRRPLDEPEVTLTTVYVAIGTIGTPDVEIAIGDLLVLDQDWDPRLRFETDFFAHYYIPWTVGPDDTDRVRQLRQEIDALRLQHASQYLALIEAAKRLRLNDEELYHSLELHWQLCGLDHPSWPTAKDLK